MLPARKINWNFHLRSRWRKAALFLAISLAIVAIAVMKGIKIATMTSIFNPFIHGELDPLPVHVFLIGVAILAEIAVARGIVLESPPPEKRSKREKWGVGFVLWGVLVSATFTILLFVFDEGMSHTQQSKIIELIAQEPRDALVRGAIRKTLVESLRPFAGQNIDVRFSAVVFFGANGDWASIPNGYDIVGLAESFLGVLKDAKWNSPEKPLPSDLQGQGLQIEVVRTASQKTVRAAKALAEALKRVPLAVEGPFWVDEVKAKRLENKVVLPEFGKETIILIVLTHP